MTRTRYQRGSIRVKNGSVYGEWRGEPGPQASKRPHFSVLLGSTSDVILKGATERKLTRADWRDRLRPHIEKYYETRKAPSLAGVTLADFVRDIYLPAHEPGWAAHSKSALRANLRINILKPLGQYPIGDIQKAAVVDCLNQMRAKGRAKNTMHATRWLLGSIFEEAIDNELIARNPVRHIRLRNIPDAEETRPLTEDEVRRIYQATSGMVRIFWRTMLGCGLRPGECAALRRHDVGDKLRIDETLGKGGFGPTKTRKVRWCPIPESLRAELEAWMQDVGLSPQTLLFAVDGAPMGIQWMRDHVQNAVREAAEIPDLTLRQARTTFATLVEGDLKDVQELLGHTAAAMTLEHYKKAIPERQRKAVEALDARLTRPALKVVAGGRK